MGKKEKNGKKFQSLMKDLDPFERHSDEHKFAVWTSELRSLELALEADPRSDTWDCEEVQRCGGNAHSIRERIRHIKNQLATPRMQQLRRHRERRQATKLVSPLDRPDSSGGRFFIDKKSIFRILISPSR